VTPSSEAMRCSGLTAGLARLPLPELVSTLRRSQPSSIGRLRRLRLSLALECRICRSDWLRLRHSKHAASSRPVPGCSQAACPLTFVPGGGASGGCSVRSNDSISLTATTLDRAHRSPA
jgi:hypothetical protein